MTKPAAPQPTPLLAASGSLLLGGSTTFLLNLVRGFQELKLPMPILGLTEAYEHREDFEAMGAEVNCVPMRGRIYEDRLLWGYQHAARHRPQAVLACLSGESFEMLRLVPPGVLRMGIIQSDDPGPYGLPRSYAPWLDVMVGVSKQICERLRAMPECKRLRIEYIPYGIQFPPPLPRASTNPGSPLRVVYIGRIIEIQKRVSRLAELIQRLQDQGVKVEFTIVGDGPDMAGFRAAVERHPNVRLLGNIPNHQIAGLLREQDVFVLLSDFEGLPLSLLEAMGAGVVPVVSDLESGMREAVREDAGVRVPVGDVAAAANALAALASDRARLARMSAAAAKLAREEYSAARMVARYLQVIRAGTDGKPVPVWPERIEVPAPLVASPWLYRGGPRKIRRLLKRFAG